MYDGLAEYNGAFPLNWRYANKGKNRYYLLNTESVMGELGFNHTGAKEYFEFAAKIIKNETSWCRDLPELLDGVSHTQLNLDKRRAPKLFGHAVVCIVALEAAGRRLKPDFNVYEWLRILPAMYFVDRFDERQRKRFETYDGLPSFEKSCLSSIDQENAGGSLLRELSFGYCATKYTCDRLVSFIKGRYPADQIGPVRISGDDAAVSQKLGNRNAAPSLIVPRTTHRMVS